MLQNITECLEVRYCAENRIDMVYLITYYWLIFFYPEHKYFNYKYKYNFKNLNHSNHKGYLSPYL